MKITNTIKKFNRLARLEQSIFGIPFLLSALVFGLSQHKQEICEMVRLLWIFPAFFAARICGMSLNHVIDRHIDVKNLRTEQRPVASGIVSATFGMRVALFALAVFLFSAFQLGKVVAFLSFIGAFFICIYSFMKRIHASCHFIIALIHFLSPLITYIAVADTFNSAIVFLSSIAFFSIAGSEVIYAIQDCEFDRKEKLHSIPAKYGPVLSMRIAAVMHVCALIASLLFGVFSKSGPLYYLSLPIIAGWLLLCYRRWKINSQWIFWGSAFIGSVLLFFISVDIVWRAL